MCNARRWLVGVSASLVLTFGGGCGDGAPAVTTARTEATVKGTVTVKGKKADSGTVVFNPANSERKDVGPVSATIGKDGSYSLKTLVGTNRVTVSGGALLKAAPEIQHERIVYEVQAGENDYNIELPAKK